MLQIRKKMKGGTLKLYLMHLIGLILLFNVLQFHHHHHETFISTICEIFLSEQDCPVASEEDAADSTKKCASNLPLYTKANLSGVPIAKYPVDTTLSLGVLFYDAGLEPQDNQYRTLYIRTPNTIGPVAFPKINRRGPPLHHCIRV